MGIEFSCPISGKQRDNTTVRIVAGFVFVLTGSALLAAWFVSSNLALIILGALSLDFIIRAFIEPKYSPLATLARGAVSAFKLPRIMVDSAPKVFAAQIGVIFSVVATVLLSFKLLNAGSAVLTVLLVCAALESFFSFCLGCRVYSVLPKKAVKYLSREIVPSYETVNQSSGK